MNGKELNYVRDTVDNEGFDYAFIDYSEFKDIQDPEFHKRREAYVKAHSELKDYLGIE